MQERELDAGISRKSKEISAAPANNNEHLVMIIIDGKNGNAKAKESGNQNFQAEGLAAILGEKLDGFLTQKLGVLLEEIRKSKGRLVESSGTETINLDDENSLRNIADLMASRKTVETTNIVNLGNKHEIMDENGEKSKTIDLLEDVL